MTKQHVQSLWRFFWVGLGLVACLLLASTVSLGEIKSTSSSTDCRLVANPDECYRNQGRQKWNQYNPSLPALNTDTLGLEGPFRAELKYDAELSWILGAQYIHMFSESAGLAAKFTGGPNELRGNLTAGYAFSKDHQVKLTYEYLTQNLPFDFASGTINEWVAQHSFGAAYQFVIRHEIVHSLELSGYITRAGSKDLDNVVFNQQTVVPGADYLYDVNYRRIAGGKENTVLASINLFPFATPTTTLTLGAGYSSISYDTRYEDNQAATTPAYKAELAHLLSSKAKITASTTGTAGSKEHSVGVSHLLPNNFEFSVKGQYTQGQGTLKDNKSVTLGLTYPAPDSYSLGGFSEVQELKNWIDKPIVYATRVLAIKDELVKRFEVKSTAALSDQEKFFYEQLTPVPTTTAFSFDPSLQATYTVLVEKILPDGNGQKPTSGRDYTKDLNLALVADLGPNQATLRSATSEGIPPVDTTGASTEGSYKVTITGTITPPGAAPFVASNSFKLTVKGSHTPDWDDTGIPEGYMGYVYPRPDATKAANNALSSNGLEDLTAKVTVHKPDEYVVFEIVDGPTDWLTIQDCPTIAGHKCLASVGGAPIPTTITTGKFNVTIKATPMPSGENPSQKAFEAKVNEEPPVWTLPAITPAIDINGSQEQKTLDIKPYITAGTLGLRFQEGEGFDPTNWSLTEDGKLTFIGTNPDYLGLKSVPVKALNKTYHTYVAQNIPVNIYNSLYTVNWIGNTLPDAQAGMPYNKNLNDLSDIVNPLLQTLNGTTPVPTDRYDFEIIGTPSQGDWTKPLDKDDTGAISILNGTNLKVDPTTKTGTVSIVFKAKSHDANKYATPEQQTVTLNVTQNHSLNAAWTGEKALKSWVAGTPSYSENLGAPASGKVLVETFSGTLPLDPADTYLFKSASTLPENWSFDESTKLLTNALPLRGTYSFLFTAQSAQSGELATGGTGGDTEGTQQLLTVDVAANPDLDVKWARADYPIHVPAGTPYTSADLNTLKGSDALVKTKDGAVPDVYTFAKISSQSGWDLSEGSNVLKNSEPMVGQTNTIILTAKSFQADKLALGGNVPAHPDQQEVTIVVDPNPSLNVTWINDHLNKLGQVGTQYTEDLAAVQKRTGEALLQTQNSPNDTYTFSVVGQSANPRPGEWYVPAGTSMLTNDSPPLAPEGVIVPLKAISKQTGKEASGGSGGKILVKINSDTSLAVNWTGAKDLQTVATTGRAYAIDLNELNRDKEPELVQTLHAGTPIAGDDYTFTVIGQKPVPETGDWYIQPGTTILKNDAVPQPAAGEKAHVTLGVQSVRAPTAVATGGTGGADPSQQVINITVNENPEFVVSWTGDDKLDHQGNVGAKYTQDLSASPAVGHNPLVMTRDGTLPFGDTYTFTVVGQSPTPAPGDWYVAADGVTLTNDNPALSPPGPEKATKVLLAVQSNTVPTASVIGGNGPNVSQQYIKVVINKNPALPVNWIADKQLPIVAKAGELINPQSLSLNSATLITTDGHPEDTYKFNWSDDFTPPPGWSLTDQDVLKKDSLSVIGTEELIFKATSDISGNQALGGNMSTVGHPEWQKYTIVTVPNEDLNVNWTDRKKLPDTPAGKIYEADLAVLQASSDPLLKTTNSQGSLVPDTYDYSVTDSGWTIDGTTLKSNDPLLVDEPGKSKTITVHLKALSTQQGKTKYASEGSKGELDITINPSPETLSPKWTGNHKVITPSAKALVPPDPVDLTFPSDPDNPMVRTFNQSGTKIADTYKFTQVNDALFPKLSDWDVVDNKLVYVGDTKSGPKRGQYRMAIQAQSTQAYPEVASGGTEGSTDKVQIITINVDPNKDLTVKWQQNKFAFNVPAGVTNVLPNLNTLDPAFVKTNNGAFSEQYQFYLESAPSRGTWSPAPGPIDTLTGKGLVPSNDDPTKGPVIPDVSFVFRAHSPNKDDDADNMDGTSKQQTVTLHVIRNEDLKPAWKPQPILETDTAASTYSVDLNVYNTVTKPKTLVFTTPDDEDPYYDFELAETAVTPTGTCDAITADPDKGRFGLLNCKGLSAGDSTIKLKAKSRNAAPYPGYAVTTPVSTDFVQQVTLKMPLVPMVDPATKPVLFDKVTVDSATDPNAFNLSDRITNKAQFSQLKFEWCQAGTTPLKCDDSVPAPAHWQIAPKDGNIFLIRTKDNNTVYAGDVGESFQPLMAVTGMTTGGWSKPTIIGQGSNILTATVSPDPNVTYTYADTAPDTACARKGSKLACDILTITSDGAGGQAKYEQPTLQTTKDTLKTFAPDGTLVSGDTGAVFVRNSVTAAFMTLGTDGMITFGTPTLDEYKTYAVNSPYLQYLNVQSKASGTAGVKDQNLTNLPPVLASKLVVVPYKKDPVNTDFQTGTDNRGPNVFVGITPTQSRSQNACKPASVRTVTSLRFELPSISVSGYSYYVTSLTPQWLNSPVSGTRMAYVCTGLAGAKSTYYRAFVGADGQRTCSGEGALSGNYTWDAEMIHKENTRCSGSGVVPLPNVPFKTTGTDYNLGTGGKEYVLVVTANDYNSGLSNNFQGTKVDAPVGPSAIPNPDKTKGNPKTVFDDEKGIYTDLLSRGLSRTAPMLGDDYTDYSNFPVIELKKDKKP